MTGWLVNEPRDHEFVSDETLRELIAVYYKDNPSGGSAHVVFDEREISDETMRYCIQYAVVRGDWVCAGLLMELLKRHPMTREEMVK